MRMAVISDIHGNVHAFEKVRKAIIAESADEIVFLGDIAFFGLYPQDCFDMLQSLSPSVCIKGNTDANIEELDQFIPSSDSEKNLLDMCRFMEAGLNSHAKNEIKSWKIAEAIERNTIKMILCHGSPYSYKDRFTEEQKSTYYKRIQEETADFVFCGHTHQSARFRIGETQIINCGAIGYSLDGENSASYGLLHIPESGQADIEIKRINYDIGKYKREIIRNSPPFREGLLYLLEHAEPKPEN